MIEIEYLRISFPLIRDSERMNVYSLHPEDPKKPAAQIEIARATADLKAAVGNSDVVCPVIYLPPSSAQSGSSAVCMLFP